MPPEPTAPTPVEAKARWFRWECTCGAKGNRIGIDKHGRPYASCPRCYTRIFWGDPNKFLSTEPFCRHWEVRPVPTKKKGRETRYCPACRIRVFQPAGASW